MTERESERERELTDAQAEQQVGGHVRYLIGWLSVSQLVLGLKLSKSSDILRPFPVEFYYDDIAIHSM